MDYWGWSLRQVTRPDIAQDDVNLIVGGNAARLLRLPVPHTRLFREEGGGPARGGQAPVAGGTFGLPEDMDDLPPMCC